MSELKTVSIVLFIAAGALVFILLFCFGKRQITRFTLKSARRPHVSIGSGTPKKLKREIQRRFDKISHIKYEPQLVNDELQRATVSGNTDTYIYRMKAVDCFSQFDNVLKSEIPEMKPRHPSESVHMYLLSLHPTYLSAAGTNLIQQFSDAYEHARHDPMTFGEPEYNHYMELLDDVINCLKIGIRKNKDKEADAEQPAPVCTEVVFSPGQTNYNTGTTKTCVQVNAAQSHSGVTGQSKYRSRVSTGGSDSGHSSHQSSMEESAANIDKLALIKQGYRGKYL